MWKLGQNLWLRIDIEHWQRRDCRRCAMQASPISAFLSAVDWTDAARRPLRGHRIRRRWRQGEEDDEASAAPQPRRQCGDGGGETRFQLIAQLHSPARHAAVLIKADVPEAASSDGSSAPASVPSIIDVFAGADWHEREAHEMFGLVIDGHPNLAHIYLPTEFEGHPLRKDFPLLARAVKPWPGVVDIEEIPPELEAQLEAEVMAEFEASGAGT